MSHQEMELLAKGLINAHEMIEFLLKEIQNNSQNQGIVLEKLQQLDKDVEYLMKLVRNGANGKSLVERVSDLETNSKFRNAILIESKRGRWAIAVAAIAAISSVVTAIITIMLAK